MGRCGRVVYVFRVLSGMAVRLHLHLQGVGRIRVRTEAGGLAAQRIVPSVQSYRLMVRIPFQTAVQSLQVSIESLRRTQVRILSVAIEAVDRDEDRDGIGNGVERMLGASANVPRPYQPESPRTCYQTGADYDPRLDLAADVVLLHSYDPARLANWKRQGRTVWVMVGFRDYKDYVRAYPEHGQQRCDGAPIQVEGSFYLVPTD